jgi:hypothetical protein
MSFFKVGGKNLKKSKKDGDFYADHFSSIGHPFISNHLTYRGHQRSKIETFKNDESW